MHLWWENGLIQKMALRTVLPTTQFLNQAGSISLSWFPSFALCIPTVHNFCIISMRKWACAHTKHKRFPSNYKLDSVIHVNACFLFNEQGDPHFLFYKFNENNILNNWEKNWQKSMATFLANKINATDRDITGPTEQVQIMFLLQDKNIN